jgi:hypothetical protein
MNTMIILAFIPVLVYGIWAWHNSKKMEIAVHVRRLDLEQEQLALGVKQHEAMVMAHSEQRQAFTRFGLQRPVGGLS